MVKYIQITFILAAAVVFSSCEIANKPAKGLEDEIIVVADSVEFSQLEDVLRNSFERTIYTPQPEKLFTLKRISLNQIEEYQTHKNIILIGTNNDDNVISKFIRAIMDTAASKGINTDHSVYMKYDVWAKNQLIVMMTGNDVASIKNEFEKQGDNLVYAFHQLSDKRLYESLYSEKDEQKEVEGKLLKDHGWIIYVHRDFKIAKQDEQNNFVKLSCAQGDNMHRWIFVHWIDKGALEYLTEDSIRAIRNRITNQHFRPQNDTSFITLSQDSYMSSEIDFKGRYAIITQGVWNLNSKGMEGPFINYTVFDEKSGKIFMLDGSIYAPKYYKRNLLQQLDVILQSFMTSDEIPSERKEELLQAVSK